MILSLIGSITETVWDCSWKKKTITDSDEFLPQVQFFPTNSKVCLFSVFWRVFKSFPPNFNFSRQIQKFVYFQCFDEIFPNGSISISPVKLKACLFSEFKVLTSFFLSFKFSLQTKSLFIFSVLTRFSPQFH